MPLEIPPPLPDELVYSALARAKYRLGWATTPFSQRLFGGRTIIVRPHLCGQLDTVATTTAAAAGWTRSAEQLRDRHTLFPLISPLLNDQHWPKCVAALHGDRVSRNHVGVCRQILGVTPFTLLKTCPTCRRKDRGDFGEAYFHGIHQVPGVWVCAIDGEALQECEVSAEPDYYTALDEITEFRRLRIPQEQVWLQLRIASGLHDLMRTPEQPGSVADFLPLLRRLSGHGTSPIFEMLNATAAARAPLRLVADPSSGVTKTGTQVASRSTDEKWLRLARRFLPRRVSELQATYRRRIAWLTLRREIESYAKARLPARAHIPRTADYIESLVETKLQAVRRITSHFDREEQQQAA